MFTSTDSKLIDELTKVLMKSGVIRENSDGMEKGNEQLTPLAQIIGIMRLKGRSNEIRRME